MQWLNAGLLNLKRVGQAQLMTYMLEVLLKELSHTKQKKSNSFGRPQNENETAETVGTVSYTHLDVYKRQLLPYS